MTWIRVLSFYFSFHEDSVNLTKDLNFFFQLLGSKFSKDCRSVPCLQQDWQRWQQQGVAEQRRSFHYPWDQCLTRRLLEWWREGHCWDYLTKWNCWMEWWTTGHWGCPGLTAENTEQGKWQFGKPQFPPCLQPPKRKYPSSSNKEPALEPLPSSLQPRALTSLYKSLPRGTTLLLQLNAPGAAQAAGRSCITAFELFSFQWEVPIPVLI